MLGALNYSLEIVWTFTHNIQYVDSNAYLNLITNINSKKKSIIAKLLNSKVADI